MRVEAIALHRDEQVAGLHAAAVGDDALDRDVFVALQRRRRE